MIDRERYQMRKPCRCGHELGHIIEVSGQDTVRCNACDLHCYNAPRSETGRPVRNIKTRDGIDPSLRARILIRDGNRCVICRAEDTILHVGHIVSLKHGAPSGLTDDELNDEENLAAMCEACNLGLGPQPLPLRTAIAILRARISWRDTRSAS
jgi:5-methylcytosine-specific restriction endonuclease McrA